MSKWLIRLLCGRVYYHEPTTPLDKPLSIINEHGTITVNQYLCVWCDRLFWQFGWSRWIQILDTDKRMDRVR